MMKSFTFVKLRCTPRAPREVTYLFIFKGLASASVDYDTYQEE